MNATLEEMARALFKSWFVDFDPVRAKMEGRDTGLPARSPICSRMGRGVGVGRRTVGWKVGTLGEAIIIHDSKLIPPVGNVLQPERSVPVLRCGIGYGPYR